MNLIYIPLALFLFVWWDDFSFSRKIRDKRSVRIQLLGILSSLLIIAIPLYLVNIWLPGIEFNAQDYISSENLLLGSAIVLSGLISFCWYLFISWLDIYEREKFVYVFLTFTMACGSTFLVYAISPLWDALGLHQTNEFLNDFFYASLRIGATEELVKILPFLIMYWFSKQVDEPFDFILFGSTCALGFAFIENIGYLRSSNLDALNGRVFYATVSHMFDTGIITYSMAIAKYKGKSVLKAGLIGFVLASLAHGFYDVWLLSESKDYVMFTTLFFLVSIHLFATMKNNLINISQYYQPEKRLDVILNKTRLFNLLLLIMFCGHIAFYLVHDQDTANYFLKDSIFSYTFIMIYLVLSFNSTNIIHGYIAPLAAPRAILLPLANRQPDYLGLKVRIRQIPSSDMNEGKELSLTGVLAKRLVLEGDLNWYHFSPDESEDNKNFEGDLIVKPARFQYLILQGKYQYFKVALISEGIGDKVKIQEDQLKYLGKVLIGKNT